MPSAFVSEGIFLLQIKENLMMMTMNWQASFFPWPKQSRVFF